jgi:hypothetical protein
MRVRDPGPALRGLSATARCAPTQAINVSPRWGSRGEAWSRHSDLALTSDQRGGASVEVGGFRKAERAPLRGLSRAPGHDAGGSNKSGPLRELPPKAETLNRRKHRELKAADSRPTGVYTSIVTSRSRSGASPTESDRRRSASRKRGSSSMGRLLWAVYCAGGIMLSTNASLGGEKQSPNVKKLVAEASEKEPFGWPKANPLLDRDVPEALAYIKGHADYTSYCLLLIIRKFYPAAYKALRNEDKSAVLCSALKNTAAPNDWGNLTPSSSSDGRSAKALLETGQVALKYLVPILDDDSPAHLYGSAEATYSIVYGYRRKDFAYRYASLILGKSPVFRADPKERDKDIEALKAELKKDASGETPRRR